MAIDLCSLILNHINYLDRPDRRRLFDRNLFDALARIVSFDRRGVRALEVANLLPGAIFASDVIPTNGPNAQRRQARQSWLQAVQRTLEEADLLFLDPDNGSEPASFSHSAAKGGKSITLDELRALTRSGRCLIVYHHHTRRNGGHHCEIDYWANGLWECGFAKVDALRARPHSPRVFFLLDPLADVRQQAQDPGQNYHVISSLSSGVE